MYLEFFAIYFYWEDLSPQVFYSWIRTIILFELFTDEPIWWHASISFAETLTSILSYILITFCSRFWSGTLWRIPQISMLFFRPYCSKELWSLSSDITLLSKSLTFFLRRWFSTWRLLIITSFKFSIALSKPSNLEAYLFSKLKIKLAVSDITEDSDGLKFALDDTFFSTVETGLFIVF